MKRVIAGLALAVLGAAPALADQRVTVPEKTPIKLVSESDVGSVSNSAEGQELEFHVGDPVVVDGWVVIPADAKAVGHITKSGGMSVRVFGAPKDVPFTYVLDYVISADGGKIKLDDTPLEPPAGKSAHVLFVKAQSQSAMAKGTVVMTSVDHTVHVLAKQKGTATAGGFDK